MPHCKVPGSAGHVPGTFLVLHLDWRGAARVFVGWVKQLPGYRKRGTLTPALGAPTKQEGSQKGSSMLAPPSRVAPSSKAPDEHPGGDANGVFHNAKVSQHVFIE